MHRCVYRKQLDLEIYLQVSQRHFIPIKVSLWAQPQPRRGRHLANVDFGLCRAARAQPVGNQPSGVKPCFLSSLRISFTAAALARRRCTSRSRTSPSSSTARHSQNRRPARPSHRDATSTMGAGVGRVCRGGVDLDPAYVAVIT
jgi:hypothetical protein